MDVPWDQVSNVHCFCPERNDGSKVGCCSFSVAVTQETTLDEVLSPFYAVVGRGFSDGMFYFRGPSGGGGNACVECLEFLYEFGFGSTLDRSEKQ